MCRKFGCETIADGLVTGGKSIDEARAAVLEHMGTTDPVAGIGMVPGAVRFGADARDKFRGAIGYVLLSRSGLNIPDLVAVPGHEDFQSCSLREMARVCLQHAGQSTGGDIMSLVGRALTTSDLPYVLADAANKSLLAGFAEAEETFEEWTSTLPASDFKALNIVSISTLDGLSAINEHGEFTYGYMSDKKESITLGTAGKIYPISRRAIINDDLNAITGVFAAAGGKAKKYEGDLVYAVLTTNAAMAEDSVTLFHSVTHGNVGTDGPPDTDTLNEMDRLFGAQTGINSERLNIPIKYIIGPRGYRGPFETFFGTVEYKDANGLIVKNIYHNSYVRLYEARLTGTGWYAAGPKGSTVVRTHLNGVKTPYTEQRTGWTVDGVELKVRYDVAAGAVDWRAMGYNAGR